MNGVESVKYLCRRWCQKCYSRKMDWFVELRAMTYFEIVFSCHCGCTIPRFGTDTCHNGSPSSILKTFIMLQKPLLTWIDFNFLSDPRRYWWRCITKKNERKCGEEGRECVLRICLFRECVLRCTRHAYKISGEVICVGTTQSISSVFHISPQRMLIDSMHGVVGSLFSSVVWFFSHFFWYIFRPLQEVLLN